MFSGRVKAEWLDDGRNMCLLETLTFIDSAGKLWEAPAGSVINGASVPGIFWQIIGSPYTGKYRRAAVIHDVYCGCRTEPHRAVHKVFNEMMEFDGVDDLRRIRMFKAVWYFGPKWSPALRRTQDHPEMLPMNLEVITKILDAKPWPL